MIIPSRWFAGGMGLDSFRERMLSSKNFRNLVDFANASDLFPGVEIKGGVSYFLWDKNYDGKCETVLVQNGEYGSKLERYLGEHGDTFIRFNEAIPILEKVINKKYKPLSNLVSGVNPFDLPTNFKDFVEKSDKSTVKLFMRGTTAFVNKNKIKKNLDLVSSWKVMVSQAYGAGDGYPHQIIGKPFVSKPNEACTMTYLVVGPCRNQIEANNLCLYLQTKFARFLIALKKNTQHLSKTKFDFVPNLDFSKTWSDEELVKEFRITKTEQNFIAQIVREIGSVDD
jgi:site-specific DNA-methyltransferase (adenine-specific)